MSAVRRAKRPVTRGETRTPPRIRVVWTRRAEADLEAIGEYIAADNPVAAERWVNKLMEQARKAADAPLGGRVVPEVGMQSVREVFLRTYRLVYRVRPTVIVVLTIFEGHRRFPIDVDVDDAPDAQALPPPPRRSPASSPPGYRSQSKPSDSSIASKGSARTTASSSNVSRRTQRPVSSR